MTMTLQQPLLFFVSLFTLYSPLANIGPYASLVGHFPRPDQRKLASAVCINVQVVMLLFVWIGQVLKVDSKKVTAEETKELVADVSSKRL